jgi:hypothetical protein
MTNAAGHCRIATDPGLLRRVVCGCTYHAKYCRDRSPLIHIEVSSYRLENSNVKNVEQFELSVEYGLAIKSKPPVQYGCIDAAEVSVELHGAVIQIGKAGM